MADQQPQAGATKTVVWNGPAHYSREEFKYVGAMHARRVSKADFGTSQDYLFTAADKHQIEMPAADADAILASGSAGEFRIKG